MVGGIDRTQVRVVCWRRPLGSGRLYHAPTDPPSGRGPSSQFASRKVRPIMSTLLDSSEPDWLVTMPKVELHVHLEGTLNPATLLTLARRYDVDLGIGDEQPVDSLFKYGNFTEFIETFTMCSDCLRTAADLGQAVDAYAVDLSRQGVRYAELHFNPEPHVRKRGLSFTAMLDGMNRGRMVVRHRFGVEMRWIADGVRDAESGPISVMITVDWLTGLTFADGVVALGLGGDEIGHPPAQFAAAFAKARAAGLHTVAHAGETTGPETIWSSLRDLQVERIGHGVRAVDDPLLLAHLAEAGIPLEMCPTSNVRTRVVDQPTAHPFRRIDKAGVCVTVNTDDPALFGCTLTDEYRVLTRDFGYQLDDIKRISINAVEASFLVPEQKRSTIAEFRESWTPLLDDLGAGSPAQ